MALYPFGVEQTAPRKQPGPKLRTVFRKLRYRPPTCHRRVGDRAPCPSDRTSRLHSRTPQCPAWNPQNHRTRGPDPDPGPHTTGCRFQLARRR